MSEDVERPGMLNEPHIMVDVEIELHRMMIANEYMSDGSAATTMLKAYTRVFAKRGMLTDIGLQVLKDYR